MTGLKRGFLGALLLLGPLQAPAAESNAALMQFNTSLHRLASRVSNAVVQIQVAGLGLEKAGGTTEVLTRQNGLGSGFLVDADGYILTNAHVVKGAQRIKVLVPVGAPLSPKNPKRNHVFTAEILGEDAETDIALLKIDGKELPTVPLAPEQPVHSGEMVMVVGSPEGLQNSVSVGVVSSVGRQPDPNTPMVFIQTDAAINPGNSGGPLFNLEGQVIGMNTFILSSSGGNEGIGFAIPARRIQRVYEQLRKQGRVRRLEIQAAAQAITPTLAAGLGLAQDWGVMISDVAPGGPAHSGGLKAQDIVLSVDGTDVLTPPDFRVALVVHPLDKPIEFRVLRGTEQLKFSVPAIPRRDSEDNFADLINPKNRFPRIGIFAVDFRDDLRPLLPHLRLPSGVLVLAHAYAGPGLAVGLRPGDLIHALNQTPVTGIEGLKAILEPMKSGDPGVLCVERQGRMIYLPFEME